MTVATNYTGCQVIINDGNGNILARTRISEYNKYLNTITVEGKVLTLMDQQHVTLLILIKGGVHEYNGTLRKSLGNSTEIALYKGRIKESRSAKRYKINAPAAIESLIVGIKPIPLSQPIAILVENISTSGILFQSKPNSFGIKAKVQIKIPIGEQSTVVNGTILRVNNITENTAEYACQFY